MDYSLPGSSVHGILQARILEWVTITFSYGILEFSLVRDWAYAPCIGRPDSQPLDYQGSPKQWCLEESYMSLGLCKYNISGKPKGSDVENFKKKKKAKLEYLPTWL